LHLVPYVTMCNILTLLCISNFVCFWENLLTPPHSDPFHTLAIAIIPSPDTVFTCNLLLNKGCTNHLPDIKSLRKLFLEAALLIWVGGVQHGISGRLFPSWYIAIHYSLRILSYDIIWYNQNCWSRRLINHKQKWNFKTPSAKGDVFASYRSSKLNLISFPFLCMGWIVQLHYLIAADPVRSIIRNVTLYLCFHEYHNMKRCWDKKALLAIVETPILRNAWSLSRFVALQPWKFLGSKKQSWPLCLMKKHIMNTRKRVHYSSTDTTDHTKCVAGTHVPYFGHLTPRNVQVTGYPNLFRCFMELLPENGKIPQIIRDRFLPNPFQFIIH
jgi:hypothetical protein